MTRQYLVIGMAKKRKPRWRSGGSAEQPADDAPGGSAEQPAYPSVDDNSKLYASVGYLSFPAKKYKKDQWSASLGPSRSARPGFSQDLDFQNLDFFSGFGFFQVLDFFQDLDFFFRIWIFPGKIQKN